MNHLLFLRFQRLKIKCNDQIIRQLMFIYSREKVELILPTTTLQNSHMLGSLIYLFGNFLCWNVMAIVMSQYLRILSK